MALTTVYQYFASNGALIYVGITDRGTRRLHEHAESKPWWELATGCTLEHFKSREDALAREKQLIQRFKPPYNYQHNPERSVPVEVRAAKRLQMPAHKQGTAKVILGIDPKELKRRRREFSALPEHERRIAACVVCGIRPGNGRPTCLVCVQERALNRPDLLTGSEHREAHERLSPGDPCPYGTGCTWTTANEAVSTTASRPAIRIA